MIVLAALASASLSLAAQAADATTTTTTTSADASATVPAPKKEEAPPMPMHISAGLTHSLGTGTFVTNPNNPTFGTTLSVAPSFNYGPWGVSASERIGIEWTKQDGATYANQLDLADVALRGSYSGFQLPEYGLGLSLSGGYNVPVSLASRGSGSLGGVAASVRGAWNASFGLGVYAALSGNYNFLVPSLASRFAQQPVKSYEDRGQVGTVTPQICVGLSEQELNSYGCSDGGIPTIASWGPGVGVSYTMLEGQLAFALDLGYRQAFSAYAGPDDEFTADNARTGIVPRQSMSSNLGVSWTPMSWFTLSGGLFTGSPFLSADGSRPRFPLWDFESPYNNLSSFYIDTTFSI